MVSSALCGKRNGMTSFNPEQIPDFLSSPCNAPSVHCLSTPHLWQTPSNPPCTWLLSRSSFGSSVPLCVCSHLNNKHPDCRPHAPFLALHQQFSLMPLLGPLSLLLPSSPPPCLVFSALSNVSRTRPMFSGSQLLGAKRAIFFLIFLSVLLFCTLNGVMKHRNHVKVRKALLWRLQTKTQKHATTFSNLWYWSVHFAFLASHRPLPCIHILFPSVTDSHYLF